MNSLYEPACFKGPRYYKVFSKIALFITLLFLDSEKVERAGRKKIKTAKENNKKTSGAMRGVARWSREEEVVTNEKYILEIYDI